MGYMRHHAIIVTGWDKKCVKKAHDKAKEIFNENVTQITLVVINGYCSFLIPPDGSKEEWDESNEGDEKRQLFKLWLQNNHDLYLDWVEIQYGDDEGQTIVISHSDEFRDE